MRERKEPWQRNTAEREAARSRVSDELGAIATDGYTPPVGPDSKSLPPNGSWRELRPGLIPETRLTT